MNIKISVIIPSYNSSDTLKYTLDGLLNQDDIKNYEVIVVDSSDDGKIDELISIYSSSNLIKFIQSKSKLSPSAGRNLGAISSKGSLLVFIDSDVIPSPSLLRKIKEEYNSGHIVGGGSIVVPDFQRERFIALAQYYLQFNEYLPAGEKRIKQFIPSCNFYCDKQLFNQVGGFPDIRASEDVLLGMKLSKLTEIWFNPDSIVFHIFRENWGSFLNNQKLLGKYVAIYRKKNNPDLSQKGIIPVFLSPLFLFIKCCRIIPRILKAGRYHIGKFTISSPAFLLGLMFWTLGFIQGSMEDETP